MKILRLCVFLLPLYFTEANGQHLPDYFLKSPVHIIHNKGMGSGFFLQDSTIMYLVTARHILFDPQAGRLLSNEVSLISYEEDPFIGDKVTFRIDLQLADSLGTFITNGNEDIVLIKLASLTKSKTGKFGINYFRSVQRLSRSALINTLTW